MLQPSTQAPIKQCAPSSGLLQNLLLRYFTVKQSAALTVIPSATQLWLKTATELLSSTPSSLCSRGSGALT